MIHLALSCCVAWLQRGLLHNTKYSCCATMWQRLFMYRYQLNTINIVIDMFVPPPRMLSMCELKVSLRPPQGFHD